jgi:hypothetical protein
VENSKYYLQTRRVLAQNIFRDGFWQREQTGRKGRPLDQAYSKDRLTRKKWFERAEADKEKPSIILSKTRSVDLNLHLF